MYGYRRISTGTEKETAACLPEKLRDGIFKILFKMFNQPKTHEKIRR